MLKHLIAVAGVGVTLTMGVRAQSRGTTVFGPAEQAIIAANQQWEQAYRACNRDGALARLTSDDLVFMHAPGLPVDDKASILKGCNERWSRAEDFRIEPQHVYVFGESGGLIVGLLHVTKEPKAILRVSHVFRRENGTWRLVMHQTSNLVPRDAK